jgi:hypothetical protein
LAVDHTHMYFARASEKAIVEEFGKYDKAALMRKFPRGWRMLADRGFRGTAMYYPNLNAQLTPHFLSGRLQFTSEEVASDYDLCKLRYTCEVIFSRVTNVKGLRDVIPYSRFAHVSDMLHWGHARINLGQPLQV